MRRGLLACSPCRARSAWILKSSEPQKSRRSGRGGWAAEAKVRRHEQRSMVVVLRERARLPTRAAICGNRVQVQCSSARRQRAAPALPLCGWSARWLSSPPRPRPLLCPPPPYRGPASACSAPRTPCARLRDAITKLDRRLSSTSQLALHGRQGGSRPAGLPCYLQPRAGRQRRRFSRPAGLLPLQQNHPPP